MSDDIRAALEGPAPCDRCSLRTVCESQMLACRGYKRWVEYGGDWNQADCIAPTREIYGDIFGDE